MTELLVQLEGEEDDLDALCGIFDSPTCRVSKEDGYYYLRSSHFTPAIDEENREARAAELVLRLNVAARLLLGDNYFYVEYDGTARIENDGKRYRSVVASVGFSYQIRTFYKDATPEEAESLIAALDKQELSRVIRLLASSLDSRNDTLKRFVLGWSALEIFVYKVFSQYEKVLIDAVTSEVTVYRASRYFERITAVMKDKYRPVDKFGVVAGVLAGESSDADVEEFKRLKKVRDQFFHGQDVTITPIINAQLQELLSRYLRAHLAQTSV